MTNIKHNFFAATLSIILNFAVIFLPFTTISALAYAKGSPRPISPPISNPKPTNTPKPPKVTPTPTIIVTPTYRPMPTATPTIAPTSTPLPTATPTNTPTPTPILGKRVFLSSTSYTGNLGGLSGADAKCQTLANAANLNGNWKAWLSDSRTSAASRLTHYNGPYVGIDGAVVANNWTDLTDGTLQNMILTDETGKQKTNDVGAWTNTNIDGSGYYADYNKSCNDWSAGYWGPGAIMGIAYQTDSAWTIGFDQNIITCQNIASLYCFEQ